MIAAFGENEFGSGHCAAGLVGEELTAVVIALGAGPLLPRAVQSILDQDVPCRVIVVNTGGGDVHARLGELQHKVTVITREERHYVGAARNLGIHASVTPYIAFLAEDCVAAPGWGRARLARHKAGAASVASAMLHDRPSHLVAWAHQLLLFPRRLPHLPEREVILYSASFHRSIFERYGLFDESLKTGEDSEFLERLDPAHRPVWAPDVHTLHHNKTNFFSLIADQCRRGRRYGTEVRRLYGHTPLIEARQAMCHSWQAWGFARRGLRGRDRLLAHLSHPLVVAGCLAKMAGILSIVVWPEGETRRSLPAQTQMSQTKTQ